MRRPGRPTLPKSLRKGKVLCTRTDDQSYKAYRRAAKLAGMKFTDWVRDRLRRAAERENAA